jgi:CBS domain containing-hemolysin-like protein
LSFHPGEGDDMQIMWRVETRTPVTRIHTELAGLPEREDYETVAGLLIETLRHIPAAGSRSPCRA